jgi:isocitrate/isopropylmalate dehydrogenase
MSNKKILVLPGDGIGNEVMAEVSKSLTGYQKHGQCLLIYPSV